MFLATALVSFVLAVLVAAAGRPKLTDAAKTQAMAGHLKVSTGTLRLAGFLEVLAALGLLVGLAWAWLGAAAAAGLTLLMLVGVVAHVRVKDPLTAFAPALVLAVVSAAALALRLASA
jgi:hypothetical protein